MARKANIIGHAVDIHGVVWAIRERRPTIHGFDVLIGWPQDEPRGRGGRGVAVVPTQQLIEYLAVTRLRDTDLPIGRTAIKRLRADASIRWSWDDWWSARADDLASMTLAQFCAKHGCSIGAASQRRRVYARRISLMHGNAGQAQGRDGNQDGGSAAQHAASLTSSQA